VPDNLWRGARWYHTIEFPDGGVSPGEFDLRDSVHRVPIPASLAGQRCLDVGTRDGFWAFELERRGAGEVIGIDVDEPERLDWPVHLPALSPALEENLAERARCFDIARAALGSAVERRNRSVYDLDPSQDGLFDFAFLGTLLIHLRDPIGALAAVGRVLRPGGTLVLNETVSASLSVLRPRSPAAALMTLDAPFWWQANRQALVRYLTAAGLECRSLGRLYLVRRGPAMESPPLAWRNDLGGLGRQLLLRVGLPHVCLVAAKPLAPAT